MKLGRTLGLGCTCITVFMLVGLGIVSFSYASCPTGCSTGHPDLLPIPTNLSNADTAYFGEAFIVTWDHVWTGCGGYELEYRRAATSEWVTMNVSSGSTTSLIIRRPDGPINDPTSYELRVRSYWGSICDERFYSDYSLSGNVEMTCGSNACSTGHPDPMSIPTNLTNPSIVCFSEPFTVTWDHVWTGCGGYELEYRRSATSDWVTVNVSSGSTTSLIIRRPDGLIGAPTNFELRVRSYWGTGCDERFYSDYSQSSNVGMTCAGIPTLSSIGLVVLLSVLIIIGGLITYMKRRRIA